MKANYEVNCAVKPRKKVLSLRHDYYIDNALLFAKYGLIRVTSSAKAVLTSLIFHLSLLTTCDILPGPDSLDATNSL